MSQSKFTQFLANLGYSEEDISQNLERDTFSYLKSVATEQFYANDICVKYIFIPTANLNTTVFEKHTDLWNENRENVFVVASEQKTYLLNAKVKPNISNPLHKSIAIESFSYGINSEGFASEELKRLKETIGKDSVDSAYFFDFVIEKTKQQKTSEVDKDLLLNLIQLRNDLLKIKKAQETIHLLILRCLFIKYLEDRGIYEKDYLVNILKTGSAKKVIDAFEQIKRINGDIFKYDEFTIDDIYGKYLEKLGLFFSRFDYKSGQGTFFPYKFDKIPVQLISHVYEAFLSNAHKGNKGIYYTPAFVVKFILSHTLQPKLQEKKDVTVLDPACGSGAFLVEAFKEIVRSNNAENDYEKKVDILKKQIFGIDIDKQALQIAAFSLYLSLLEGENAEAIQEKIKNAYPILPPLINHSLIRGNSLVDDIFRDMTFDCIVANPPWGSVEETGDEEDKREREAIAQKSKVGVLSQANKKIVFPEYRNVSDYQRSQAFLLRVNKWCNKEKTLCSLIVNSPIFLNENADDFRKDLLSLYRITHFYELSHLNKIMFKKKVIGRIKISNKNENIEIGASEPCVIIVFDKNVVNSHSIKYISPKLTDLSESFELIHFTRKDVIEVKQEDLLKDDYWLWKIFVNGSWSDYQLIKQKHIEKNTIIGLECSSGFQPKRNGQIYGKLYRTLITPKDFERYYVKEKLELFNWKRDFRRNPENPEDPKKQDPDFFKGKRILIPMRPLKSDKIRLRCIRVDGDIVHKHDILRIKIKKNNKLVDTYAPYLALLSSSFIGYYTYHISSQWGKGEEKRSALRNSDIERLPFPPMERFEGKTSTLTNLVEQIETDKKAGKNTSKLEHQIDEVVFDLYDLLEYEREIIREFYQITVEREGHKATEYDFQQYVNKFRTVFSFILADHLALNAAYRISSYLGAYIAFAIVKKDEMIPEIKLDLTEDRQLLDIVKKKQLRQTLFSHRLNEDKVKIYAENKFFIVKSKYFKDWTLRQAMIDANEEIGSILKELPKK
jgi:methylase of polypeptide subunit release factors